MSRTACGLCGRDPAAGWAKMDDVRFCHGDDDPEPTCYMQAQAAIVDRRALIVPFGEDDFDDAA